MKTIIWPTNINGKLANNSFLHIDRAPQQMPTRQQLDSTEFTIMVADKSHLPVRVKVQHIATFPLSELSNIHTWPSHGIDNAEFIHQQHVQQKVTKETMLAVYYYKKIQ